MSISPSPSQISQDPELFASVFLKITDKERRLVPFYWNRAQKHFHANRTGRDLILKSRQLGFSTQIQGEMYRRTVTSSRSTITLAHDADTTTKLRLMADTFWMNGKFNGIQPLRKYANASLTTYPELNSIATIATAGTVETGRGGTYTDFHGSEVAFWPDARKLVAGAMQGGSPDVVLESTPNGAQGHFYDLCMEALHGVGVWRLHFYAWWWDVGYQIPLDPEEKLEYDDDEIRLVQANNLTPQQIKWRRNKINELKDLFPQEYPEDPVTCFLTSGKGYFGDLSKSFNAPMNAAYTPGHKYAAGLDFGQANDFTAMPVLDFTDKVQVDLLHLRGMEWAEIRRRIKQKNDKWHLDVILGEKNSIGNINIEMLRKMNVNVRPFEMTNTEKAGIMSDWNEALHEGGWQMQNYLVQKNEYNIFVATQLPVSGAWRLAASGDGHDDTVIGGALAFRAGRYAVTDEEMEAYGKGEMNEEDIDDDMIEYHAEITGMTFEESKADLIKEAKISKAMASAIDGKRR